MAPGSRFIFARVGNAVVTRCHSTGGRSWPDSRRAHPADRMRHSREVSLFTRRCLVPGSRQQCARWIIFAASALYFVYYTQVLLVASSGRLPINSLVKDPFNRSRCCVPGAGSVDVCGRLNCTRHCPDPIQPAIPDGPGDKAFFIETSGSGTLSVRQACAVESLAFHNPELDVNVLFVDDRQRDRRIDQALLDKSAGRLRDKYKNIRFVAADLDEYLAGTALEKWFHCSDWRRGPYHVSHLSDGLRFLTLAKYGGYYFDLDVLLLRSVTPFRNFVARENDKDMGSGVIHADLGSPLMQLSVQDFAANYSAGLWTHNGPLLLSRVLRRWCRVDHLQSMDYVRCQGFHVLPPTSFCPVHYTRLGQLFDSRPPNGTAWLTDQVVGVHTWNKLSYARPVYKNSTQTYNRLAGDHCPVTYAAAPDVF